MVVDNCSSSLTRYFLYTVHRFKSWQASSSISHSDKLVHMTRLENRVEIVQDSTTPHLYPYESNHTTRKYSNKEFWHSWRFPKDGFEVTRVLSTDTKWSWCVSSQCNHNWLLPGSHVGETIFSGNPARPLVATGLVHGTLDGNDGSDDDEDDQEVLDSTLKDEHTSTGELNICQEMADWLC